MKTYAEKKNKKPFDWNAFFKKRKYTYEEVSKANILSGDWVTCACGNQCSIIPRSFDGEPFDSKLERLGMNFSYLIDDMERYHLDKEALKFLKAKAKAKEVLVKIEARSSVLIKQELEKAKDIAGILGYKLMKK